MLNFVPKVKTDREIGFKLFIFIFGIFVGLYFSQKEPKPPEVWLDRDGVTLYILKEKNDVIYMYHRDGREYYHSFSMDRSKWYKTLRY